MHLFSAVAFRVGFLAAALSTSSTAQGRFVDLPSGATWAYAVSDDGSVVAGVGAGGVFRWDAVGGTQYLNMPYQSRVDMAGDGSVIMANFPVMVTPSGFSEGAFWTQAGGWTPIGGILASCSNSLSSAYGMSKDGQTIVGLGWSLTCRGRATRWDAQNGMIELGMLGTHFDAGARANTISGDGAVIGGWDRAVNGTQRASVWWPIGTSYTEVLIIPTSAANPEGGGEVWGMNHTGSVIVGEEYSGEAWRWMNGVFESLGRFPGAPPEDSGSAHATNADGSMIVGSSGSFWNGYEMFLWTDEDGMQPLERFLYDQDIAVPNSAAIGWVSEISPSGYHIVGRRSGRPDTAFLVELPAGVRYGMRRGGTNTMRLTGTGSTALFGTLTVTTDQITSSNPLVSTLMGTKSTRLPLFGGTLLVDLSQPHVVVNAAQSGGSSTFNVTIPNVPSAVGAAFYIQSVVIDPSAGGMVFSNGIKSTVTA